MVRDQIAVAEQHALIIYCRGETEPVFVYHVAHGRQKLGRAADNAVEDICERTAGFEHYSDCVEQNIVYSHGVEVLHSVHLARRAVEEIGAVNGGGDSLGTFESRVVARYHAAL